LESPIGEITLNLLLVMFLVLLNGFFVAAEFSLVKVRQTRLTQLVREGNNQRARYAQKVTKQLDAYLSACQLGITLASLGLGWVGEPAIAHYVEPMVAFFHLPQYLGGPISLAIAFAIITFFAYRFRRASAQVVSYSKSRGNLALDSRSTHVFLQAELSAHLVSEWSSKSFNETIWN